MKKKPFYTTQLKLIILLAGAFFVLFISSLFFYSALAESWKTQSLLQKINLLKNTVSKLTDEQKQFLLKDRYLDSYYSSGKSNSLNKAQKIARTIQTKIEQLSNNEQLTENKKPVFFERIMDLHQNNVQLFSNLQKQILEHGNKNYGQLKRLTDANHRILNFTDSIKNIELYQLYVQLNHFQTAYLLTQFSIYKEEIIQLIKVNSNWLFDEQNNKFEKLKRGDKIKLANDLKEYKNAFVELARTDENIARIWDRHSQTPIFRYNTKLQYELTDLYNFTLKKNTKNRQLNNRLLFLLILSLFLFFSYAAYRLNQSIKKPVQKILDYLFNLKQGVLQQKLSIKARNEFALIANHLNEVSEYIATNLLWLSKINKNNLTYKPQIDEADQLGTALLQLREDLLEQEQKTLKQREEEKKQNTIAENLAFFVSLLYAEYNELEGFTYHIISNLADKMNAIYAAIFMLDDTKTQLNLISAYAGGEKKYLPTQVKFGDGLIGTCALEKKSIFITEIPENYIEITSSLGRAKPESVLVLPLMHKNELHGVIELAAFHVFTPIEFEFLERISENIAIALIDMQVKIERQGSLIEFKNQKETIRLLEEKLAKQMKE